MKKFLILASLGFTLGLASCTNSKAEKEVAQASLNATATNEMVGSAKFYSLSDGKIKMDLEINMPQRADSTVDCAPRPFRDSNRQERQFA